MNETADNLTNQFASYQKIWMETLSGMMQTAFTSAPDSAPPEILRQMRSGIFQALAQSWEEYLRSPQFGEGMKQWMDSAIFYRKMTNDLFTRARHETQDVARQDIDSVLMAVRHSEKRLLDRIEELSARLEALHKSNGSVKADPSPATARQRPPANGTRSPARKSPRSKKANP